MRSRAQADRPTPAVIVTAGRVLPTRSGWVAAFIALTLVVSGLNSSVNIMFLISGILFGALLVSFSVAWRQVSGITVRRDLPQGVHAGETFSVGLVLANRKRAPSHALLVEDLVEPAAEPWQAFAARVPGRGTRALGYQARVSRRGVIRFAGLRLSSQFPFGLVRASRLLGGGVERELVIYPALGAVRPAFLQGQLAGIHERSSLLPSRLGLTDIHSLREYRAGDNPKWIHWRATARLGKPVVKEFDQETARRVHVVLDGVLPPHASDADRDRLERAISFAATVIAESARATRMVGLTAVGQRRVDLAPAAGAVQVRAILESLARLVPAVAADPPEPAFGRAPLRHAVVVLVVLSPDRLKDLPVAAWQSAGGTVHVVSADDPAFQDLFLPPPVFGGPASFA